MKTILEGNALVLQDYVDSEQLHPASYFSLDKNRIREGLFMGMPAHLKAQSDKQKIIVAGRYFGCGSSREVIVQSLIQNGIRVVLAESFSRIFYRNALNHGMLLLEIPDIHKQIANNGHVSVELDGSNILIKENKRIICNIKDQERITQIIQANWKKTPFRIDKEEEVV